MQNLLTLLALTFKCLSSPSLSHAYHILLNMSRNYFSSLERAKYSFFHTFNAIYDCMRKEVTKRVPMKD